MLICSGCGETIPEDYAPRMREDSGESATFCPACGDTLVPAVLCWCGDWHEEEDLLPGGYCEKCLSDRMDIGTICKYLDDTDGWEEFLTEYVPGSYKALLEMLSRLFFSRDEKEQENHLRGFVLDGHWGLFNFASWLNEVEG